MNRQDILTCLSLKGVKTEAFKDATDEQIAGLYRGVKTLLEGELKI